MEQILLVITECLLANYLKNSKSRRISQVLRAENTVLEKLVE